MSKEAQIRTVKGFIELAEQRLAKMRERSKLLNTAIPRLEQELETEKAQLVLLLEDK